MRHKHNVFILCDKYVLYMTQKEKFETVIDSRGSINVPAFLQKSRGFKTGVRVKVILEILNESQKEVEVTA